MKPVVFIPSDAVPVPGYPRYAVTPRGELFSLWSRTGRECLRELATSRRPDGYRSVPLRNDSGVKNWLVHRIVATTFLGPANRLWALHKNGVKSDNRVENLYWGTPAQNSADTARHDGYPAGDRHWTKRHPERIRHTPRPKQRTKHVHVPKWRKMPPELAAEVKSRLARGERQFEIAAVCGVTRAQVGNIKRGLAWRWL